MEHFLFFYVNYPCSYECYLGISKRKVQPICTVHAFFKSYNCGACLFKGTIEYEAHLKHENEMKRLEAELRGK